jgi:hypothetical protein
MDNEKLRKWEHWIGGSLVVVCAVGWGALLLVQHRAKDPVEVVRKHFVFYPEYRSGRWSESACAGNERAGCEHVKYEVNVNGCGSVQFDWNVYPNEDADAAYAYRGATPKIDEGEYALYAVVGEDSRFMDSPALGKQAPAACVVK